MWRRQSRSHWEQDDIVDREEILQATIRQYLESGDFNGWGTFHLGGRQEIQRPLGLRSLRQLRADAVEKLRADLALTLPS